MAGFLVVTAVVTASAVGYTARGGDDRGDAVKKELEKFAGTWQGISAEEDGVIAPEDRVKGHTFVFAGDRYTARMSGKTIEEGTFRINPLAKPKAIDVHPTRPEAKVMLGIYEIGEDGTIRARFTLPGSAATRPTEFSTTKGTGHTLQVIKRAKANHGGDDTGAAYKKELERFVGTWQIVAWEKGGVEAPEADVKQMKIIFNGDKFTMERAGKTVEQGWICIDPARKPRVIDVYPTRPEGKVEMGIYEWDGDDKLKVCCTDPGTEQARPRLFSTTKGTGHVLGVAQRVKAK
jgi:uncharacterized protein (TIGR03067 family)